MASSQANIKRKNSFFTSMHCTSLKFLYVIFLLIVFSGIAAAQNIIKTLPGYSGELPFSFETGYIGVGEFEEIQLFYYFIESQGTPTLDPILLWLTGGPGCASLGAVFYENGPIRFKTVDYNGSFPTLVDNPYTWTRFLNILYVDAPVGTGFSYSTTQEGYYMDDYKASETLYQFLRKFLTYHPLYLENNLYVGGDSYSGMMVPMVVTKILDSNTANMTTHLNIKGYLLGNPVTDTYIDQNSKIPFAHRLTLISDSLYEAAKSNCNGDYVNVNSSNAKCVADLAAIKQLLRDINVMNILEPDCNSQAPHPNGTHRSLFEDFGSSLSIQQHDKWCREYSYAIGINWVNDEGVQRALHVREGTTSKPFVRCNMSLAYTEDAKTVVSYHRHLTKSSLRSLVFSGDHDMSIPHIGTQNWINSLNMTVEDSWRAWFVDGQVAGYTEQYENNLYNMIFATVKAAGHTASTYKPKEVVEMLDRWFSYYPL